MLGAGQAHGNRSSVPKNTLPPWEERPRLIKCGSMRRQQKGCWFQGNSLFYSGQILFSSSQRLHGVMLQPLWACSFPVEHCVFAALSHEQWSERRGKVVIYSHMAENDNIAPNEQKRVELNFPKLLPSLLPRKAAITGMREDKNMTQNMLNAGQSPGRQLARCRFMS